MKKTTISLAILTFCGAGLMACSAESGGAEAQVKAVEANAKTPKPQKASAETIANITFQAPDCIMSDEGDKVDLTLTDGTKFSLPRTLLKTIDVLDEGGRYTNSLEAYSEVSRVRFSLPVGDNVQGCAKTVPVLIYPRNAQVDYAGEGNPGSFDTMYTPLYTMGEVSASDLIDVYESVNIKSRAFGEYKIFDAPQHDNGTAEVDAQKIKKARNFKFKSLYTGAQLQRHKTIRVGGDAMFHGIDFLPGLIVNNQRNLIGYYEHSHIGWRADGNAIKLSFPVGESYAAMVDVKSDQNSIDAWVADFEEKNPMWKGVLTEPLDKAKIKPDVSGVINALTNTMNLPTAE